MGHTVDIGAIVATQGQLDLVTAVAGVQTGHPGPQAGALGGGDIAGEIAATVQTTPDRLRRPRPRLFTNSHVSISAVAFGRGRPIFTSIRR